MSENDNTSPADEGLIVLVQLLHFLGLGVDAAQVQSGVLEEIWPQMALKTQQLTEACFQSARQDGRKIELF